jgi:TonB-dependent SusC/RagA subfamily outer membrane receptor
MTWYPMPALPASVILVGLLTACAHHPDTGQVSAAPDSVRPPPGASTVTSDEQGRQPATSLDQLLAGRISGVTVMPAPGGGIVVRIGGPKSFYAGEDPLFIVDGIPIESVRNGTLSWLNAHDVESITVLKDPSTAAIYGVRGANGVVIIKTKGSH